MSIPRLDDSRRDGWWSITYWLPAFLAVHVLIALPLYQSSALATGHALLTFVAGVGAAFFYRRAVVLAYVAAYIVGCDVLWRMCGAAVPWQYAKYLTCVLLLVGLSRLRRPRLALLPVCYFALLLPSTLLTITQLEFGDVRRLVSESLSGPLALVMASWFFMHLKLSRDELDRLLLTILGPITSLWTIAVYSTLTAQSISFGTESNFTTAGGFGPVQVSVVLGLGSLICFFYVLQPRVRPVVRLLVFMTSIALAAQSVLTFSRSGIYLAAGGAALATLFLLPERGVKRRIVQTSVLLFLIAAYVVVPRLDRFTQGTLSARFSDTNPTHRDNLALKDIEVWLQHPVLGVGPGLGKEARGAVMGRQSANAHNEFSRMLAEHGAFGLGSMLFLGAIFLTCFLRARTAWSRAIVASLGGWSAVAILVNGTNIVAPCLLIGLIHFQLAEEDAVPNAMLPTRLNNHSGAGRSLAPAFRSGPPAGRRGAAAFSR